MTQELINKWKEVLEDSINELHTSKHPASSDTLQEHYQKIHGMHLDLSKADNSLVSHIKQYKELLENSLNMILFGERAFALAFLRHAQEIWLPSFASALEEQ